MTSEDNSDPEALENWFKVSSNDEAILIDVSPPGRDGWSAVIKWSEIERVCYETTDILYSNDIFLFVKGRKESYRIPIDADGGMDLWNGIIDRKLFYAELAITFATADIGAVYCWPPTEP